MTYTTLQEFFISEALAGKNIYLSGKAGTGKSFIVKELIKILIEHKKRYVAIAPTGIAANNIGGQTIHSLFGINPFGISDFDSANMLKGEKRRLLNKIEVVIIDEVSMLRPDILDAMNWTLLKNGCDRLSTKQLIFIGDMAQLPPVLKDNDRAIKSI
jgi:ATP-dependent DNA helicase PIF1